MKKNQLLALLLAAVMLLAVLTGCASKTEPAPVEPAQTETAPEAETATPEEDPAPAEEPEAPKETEPAEADKPELSDDAIPVGGEPHDDAQ